MVISFTLGTFSQVPQKMSYQAVIRNNNGQLVANTQIGMQISILQGSADGTAVYIETQTPTTNANGVISIEIGTGITSHDFSVIDWGNGLFFIKAETDPDGDTNYIITGISQLLSVPYAMHSKTAEKVSGDMTETDPVFIAWNKSTGISITESQIIDLQDYATKNMNNANITNLADPINEQDAATKSYVDILLAKIEALEAREEANLIANGFTDLRDSSHYNVVKIGDQLWMAENLKYLPSVTSSGTFSITDAYYYIYDYNGTNVADAKATTNYTTYGVLYNWSAAVDGASSNNLNPSGVKGVCPAGWHLPSDAEWTELADYLGGSNVAGAKLKEIDTIHWNSPNTGATNETNFTALPGGFLLHDGNFGYIGKIGFWWSTSESTSTYAYYRSIYYDSSILDRVSFNKSLGFSVRCVMD